MATRSIQEEQGATFPFPIDWSKLAEPQADQYDTDVTLWLARSTTSIGRPQPYMRTPVGDSPSVFDGKVAIRYVYRQIPEFQSMQARYPDAPLDHPNIRLAAEQVRTWPLAFAQCQSLLEAIHPGTNPAVASACNAIFRGSLSHSYERLFGTLWSTVFCPIGLAQAIVHEMAHQKLRALGVSFESATAIVGNNPADLYVSPIIKSRLRPMTAVLHAEYSFLHVAALDIHMVMAERASDRRAELGEVLEKNLSRIESGYHTLEKYFVPGEHGREFIAGLFGWIEKTIIEGRGLLSRGSGRNQGPAVRPAPPNSNGHSPATTPQYPVVLAYNGGIGDRLCNLPALRALAYLFSGKLGLICGKGDRELYYSDLNLRAVYEVDLQLIATGWTFPADALALQMGQCDLLLSINPWHTESVSQLIDKFPHIPSVGFFPDFYLALPCDYEGHAMDMAFAVPAALNATLRLENFSQPPAASAQALAIAQKFRDRYTGSHPTLFVHADTKPEKNWKAENFVRVLQEFLREFPEFKVLVVESSDHGIAHQFAADTVVRVDLPLDSCFAVLRASHLFLGIDSCHLHAADLFRVPGVGLFGPTTSRRWGFKFTDHKHIQGQENRMDTISVAEVSQALHRLARSVRYAKRPTAGSF